MPASQARLQVDISLTAEEYADVSMGCIPRKMEDKWFVFMEWGWLNFYRSGTGICVYRVLFETEGDGFHATEAWVNRDEKEYNGNDDGDIAMLRYMVYAFMLGRPVPFPAVEKSDDDRAQNQWSATEMASAHGPSHNDIMRTLPHLTEMEDLETKWGNTKVLPVSCIGAAREFAGFIPADHDPEASALNAFKGSLLGLAVGDAIGTSVEFQPPGTFPPVTDMTGGGPFKLPCGAWTDDTSMALCLAESLILSKDFDPIDQLRRYVWWYREGYLSSTDRCFDIGNTVRDALERFENSREPFCGSVDPRSAGNGSLMRIAPAPLFFARLPIIAIEKAAESSRTTHGTPEAVDACRYMASLILGCLYGVNRDVLLSARFEPLIGYWESNPLCPAIDKIAGGSFKHRKPPEIKGTGYVVDCLEAALWAFHTTDNFRDGVLAAVNLGNDADTTGAVFGQLAGAFYGMSGIPDEWREKIAMRELIEDYASQLLDAASAKI